MRRGQRLGLYESRRRDAWIAGADVLFVAALTAAALLVPALLLLPVALLWAGVAARQGYLAVRIRRVERTDAHPHT